MDFSWPSVVNKSSTLDIAIDNWEKNSSMDQQLQLLKLSLLNVQPTSTDCERAFSIAGLFMTHLRNRLSEDIFNALMFLKNFYK